MTNYPIRFGSQTQSSCGISTGWVTRTNQFETKVAIPPEFAGPGVGLSPEDLFNQALANCFVATFKVYAEHSKLTFEEIIVSTELVVAPDENKKPVMKEFFLRAQIRRPSNPEKARFLAKKASESGFILNSVKTTCHFEFEIVE